MFKKRRQKHSFIDAQNREVKKDTKIAIRYNKLRKLKKA